MTRESETHTGGDDLDRRFHAARSDDVGEPDWNDVRRRAGEPLERRVLRFHWGYAVAVALLLGSGLGFALGTSSTPSGSAAAPPVGLGFLPASGWSVLQTGTEATPARPTLAIAANVPIRPEDDVDGLPYSTLLALPTGGVVIVASFTTLREHLPGIYPARKLPLRVRDVMPELLTAQLRPERPLGQYALRAAVSGYAVDVTVYFGSRGPSARLVTAAQRQLDRLVVGSTRPANRVEERALPIRRAVPRAPLGVLAASRIIDRTFVCSLIAPPGGKRDLDVVAQPPYVDNFRNFSVAGFIGVSSGPVSSGQAPLTNRSNRVFVRARPQTGSGTALPPGVYVNTKSCSATSALVPLSSRGLPGPPVEFEQEVECGLRGRVLVRVRALMQAPTSWLPAAGSYEGAQRNVVEATLAVRSVRTRRPIALVRLARSGRTQLFNAGSCA